INSEALYSDATATTALAAGVNLDSIFDADGNQLFSVGDVITITGATRGGASLPTATFEIGAANTTNSDAFGTTIDDLLTFLDNVFGLDGSTGAGMSLSPTGQIVMTGNEGTANDLVLADANFVVNQATSPEIPIQFTKA